MWPTRGLAVWPALAVAGGAAAAFFVAARTLADTPLSAVWGGTVWVFLLAAIIALPAGMGWQARRGVSRAQSHGQPTMGLALMVWLCTLPFVFLLVKPQLGWRAAALAGLLMLAGIMALCWSVCAWRRRPS